ncbi:conserved hypothetical protein [Gloeothece citriformis PCC 7424]|uniref:DUF2203 domain-containing protein n=1 Tax=Gloeothece citriformis (strain PCC 7424) TaxID=65393 RepID=B7KE03_GLOC7|nr:DUF2203 family protein [Gloeothece citriformis]ACK71701.1 conserved hypothetical protein [Gloeothece citriformis PCC 7424]
MSSEDSHPINEYSEEFEQDLAKAEQALVNLKQRYREIIEAQRQHRELSEHLKTTEQEWQNNPKPGLESQLEAIEAQIQELQVTLESALLSNEDLKRMFWEGLKNGVIGVLFGEIFWQIVRFGGLGIIIGWILKSCTE